MCFGGGGNNDAEKALEWQKQQARDAERRERERQARLKEGTATINKLFDGEPIMGEREVVYDWDNFEPGYSFGGGSFGGGDWLSGLFGGSGGGWLDDLFSGLEDRFGDRDWGEGSNWFGDWQNKSQNGLPPGFRARRTSNGWEVVGPDGAVYRQGDELKFKEKYDTGQRSGFGDSFYNRYRDAMLNYYMPELENQYKKARSNLTFDHARAGTLQSSMASENLSDLVYQNTMNEGLVRSKADNATGQLRQNVAQQKAAALGQLYATEDPGIAANVATNSVRTLQNTTPEFSPMGPLFQNAVVGATGFASAYDDARNWGTPPGSRGNAGRVVS